MGYTDSTAEILKDGMQCLKEKLGVIGAERFVSVVIREKFDYTKWQQQYFDDMSPEEFDNKVLEYAEKNEHKGNAKVIYQKILK